MKGILVMLILITTPTTLAEPIISSTQISGADGQVISIQGSGFGSKEPAEPWIWDDFEQGNASEVIQDWILWNDEPHPDPSYSENDAATGNQSALLNYEYQSHNAMTKYLDMPVPAMFGSIKFKYVKTGMYDSRNIKLFRLMGHMPGDEVHGTPVIAWGGFDSLSGLNPADPEATDYYQSWNTGASPGGSCRSSQAKFYTDAPRDIWHTTSQWIMQSNHNTSNGIAGLRHNNHTQERNDVITYCDGAYQNGFDQASIGLYLAHDRLMDWDGDGNTSEEGDGWQRVENISYLIYVDDVYIDSTLARIEICDSDDWLNAYCEVQLPTAWNNNHTSFVVREGFLSPGNNWLYIINSQGEVSSPTSILLGTVAEPFCGDGVCNGEENSESCYQDCPIEGDINADGYLNIHDFIALSNPFTGLRSIMGWARLFG